MKQYVLLVFYNLLGTKMYRKIKKLVKNFDPTLRVVEILNRNNNDSYLAIKKIKKMAERRNSQAVVFYVDIKQTQCSVTWIDPNRISKTYNFVKSEEWRFASKESNQSKLCDGVS